MRELLIAIDGEWFPQWCTCLNELSRHLYSTCYSKMLATLTATQVLLWYMRPRPLQDMQSLKASDAQLHQARFSPRWIKESWLGDRCSLLQGERFLHGSETICRRLDEIIKSQGSEVSQKFFWEKNSGADLTIWCTTTSNRKTPPAHLKVRLLHLDSCCFSTRNNINNYDDLQYVLHVQ